jgi:hypothetical protein
VPPSRAERYAAAIRVPVVAAAVEELDEPFGVTAADHPGLEPGVREHRGQVGVDAAGAQGRELVHRQLGDRVAGGRPRAVQAVHRLDEHEPVPRRVAPATQAAIASDVTAQDSGSAARSRRRA